MKDITQLAVAILLLPGLLWAEAQPELRLVGDFVQGGLVQGVAQPGATVKVDGKPVRVSEGGLFLVGFGRDALAESLVQVSYPDGRTAEKLLRVARREYKVQRIDGLPKRKVTPRSKEDLARIRKESALSRSARKRDDPRTDFLVDFIWPVTGPISGVYGSQRILNGQPRRPHFGVDIARPTGTPVAAPAAGIVTLAHPDMFFSGGTLILDHGHGLSSSFLHLSRILVEKGQRVEQGELIAEIGATGRVTGAHLDWRMNLFTKRVDPQLLVPPMPQEK
ncbi:MAG: M23 family metallopeptidase [Candidatus Polarisedimenticolaceae bacterium]|nr:M23 family metallopeptidase [Candidatus Polarisedimenticolaceae bacterium]